MIYTYLEFTVFFIVYVGSLNFLLRNSVNQNSIPNALPPVLGLVLER